MKDWHNLSIDDFETLILTGTSQPIIIPPTSTAPTPTTQADNIAAITNAVSAAILTKPPVSHTDIFLKTKEEVMK